MNSDFGSDIFDADDPQPKPAKRSPRRSAKPHSEAPADPEPEPAPPPPEPREPRAERQRPQSEPREFEMEPSSRPPREERTPHGERDDERRPRRRRRRGRGGEGRGGEGRSDQSRGGEGRGDDRGDRRPGRGEPLPRPAPRTERQTASQRLAIFVDADRLTAQASEHDGEIAFRRLLQQLAHGRPLVRAVAYVPPNRQSLNAALTAQGLDVEATTSANAASVAMAVDAMAVASRVDCIVLVPGIPESAPLVRALRTLGVRVEAAGFEEAPDTGADAPAQYHHLGRECLFVP